MKQEFRFRIRDRIWHPQCGVGVVTGHKIIENLPCAICRFPKLGTGKVVFLESRLYPFEAVNSGEVEVEFIPDGEVEVEFSSDFKCDARTADEREVLSKGKCQPLRAY